MESKAQNSRMAAGEESKKRKGIMLRPSIKDIARLANVSHPTVSRALLNNPLVSAKTGERIRRIAQEAGYRPSAVARGLLTRRTQTIGVVVTTVADPFAGAVFSGIEQTAGDHGYSVFLADSNADPERERKIVQAFAERRLDGIIVTSSRVGALYLPLLSEMGVPIVLVNNQFPGTFAHAVMIGNVEGSRAAAKHLIDLGHERIAYIGDQSGFQSDTERFAGYRNALKAARIPFDQELVSHGDGKSEAAIVAMNALLQLPELPTAVCCYNDMTALGAMHAIHSHGLRVPEDISVTGFDDLFFAALTQPPLTTVRQPMYRMGQLAMESLLRLMSGEKMVDTIRVEPELVVRKSTTSPRAGHTAGKAQASSKRR